MRKRILVVDDEAAVTAVLRRTLSHAGYDVSSAPSGEAALQTLLQEPVDLVILDILMPGLDGLEVCERLRSGGHQVPVLMLTARDGSADEVAGLTIGADDYVTKPFDVDVLLARIEALLRSRSVEPPPRLRLADLELDVGTRTARRNGREIDLTATEFRLLHLLLRHPRQVLSKTFILDQVWGYDFGGNDNIVEVYIGGLRRKLEAQGERRLIRTMRGAGYVLRD